MGEVWAASDTRAPMPRIIAMKLAKGAGLQANLHLFDEARLASTIQSANVCRVLEFGEANGYRFLVLEWCDGASLQELLEASPERRIPETAAARIVAEVASGLHAAHELRDERGVPLNVVHRDVSPQNILLARDGRVLVTDFGIAKALDQKREATETGQVKGKTAYLAPEQIRTKAVDRRADVFALGAVLYTSLVGRKPFLGEDAVATIYQILEGDFPRPRELRPELSERLEAIVLRALAQSPDDRYPTMQSFREALEGWLREVGRRVGPADLRATLEGALGPKLDARNGRVLGALGESETTLGAESTGTQTIPTSRRVPAASPARPRLLPSLALAAGVALFGAVLLWKFAPAETPAPRPPELPRDGAAPRALAPPDVDVAPPVPRPEETPRAFEPSPAVSEAPPPSAPPARPKAPKSATTQATTPTTVTTTPATTPRTLTAPPPKKPARTLDTQNPFTLGSPSNP